TFDCNYILRQRRCFLFKLSDLVESQLISVAGYEYGIAKFRRNISRTSLRFAFCVLIVLSNNQVRFPAELGLEYVFFMPGASELAVKDYNGIVFSTNQQTFVTTQLDSCKPILDGVRLGVAPPGCISEMLVLDQFDQLYLNVDLHSLVKLDKSAMHPYQYEDCKLSVYNNPNRLHKLFHRLLMTFRQYSLQQHIFVNLLPIFGKFSLANRMAVANRSGNARTTVSIQ
ncbi:hypothetical protein Bhyg_11556, partial [Pseudolycoriella hygida]